MNNLYVLMNEKLDSCKKEEKSYIGNIEEYFIYFLIPNIIDKLLNSMDFNNYESYKKLELISIKEKINIYPTDEGLIVYSDDALRINTRKIKYFKYIIENFLEENNLGKLYSFEEYKTDFIEIDTNLNNLIKVYTRISNKLKVKDLEDYVNKIDIYSSSLDSLYVDEICSRYYYDEFLNRIYLIINIAINNIDILKYKDFDIHKEKVDKYFYLRTKGESIRVGTGLDINLKLNSLKDYEALKALEKLIKKFLNDYNLGELVFDESLKINLTGTLDNLIYAYYMEKQRLEYMLKIENKMLIKK